MARKKIIDNKDSTSDKLPTTMAAYEGTVSISIMQRGLLINKQTIHNAGVYNLFQNVCRALAGDSYSRPEFLAFSTQVQDLTPGAGATFTQPLNHKSKLIVNTIVKDTTEGGWKLNWTSTASYANFGGEYELKSLALFDSSDNLFALINLSAPIKIEAGQSLIVKWSMLFKNVSAGV